MLDFHSSSGPDSGEHSIFPSTNTSSGANPRRAVLAITALLVLVAGLYSWNAYSVGLLVGYDAIAHLEYLLTIAYEGRLPHPMEGWSTFHPPLYYLLGSFVYSALRPIGVEAAVVSVRAVSAFAMLVPGLVSDRVVSDG